MLNITPVKQKLLKIATRARRQLPELSSRHWTLHPAEREQVPPAIYDDAELERVTGFCPGTDLQGEMGRIRGGVTEHRASLLYEVRDCTVMNGSIYKQSARIPLTQEKERLFDLTSPALHSDGVMTSTFSGSRYFGHWITDDLSQHMAALDLAEPVAIERRPYAHEQGYRDRLGARAQAVRAGVFRSLMVLDDVGQNGFKRKRYLEMRRRLRAGLPPQLGGYVFIRRGASGARRDLLNESDVESWLTRRGFAVLDPEAVSVETIVKTLMDARLVVGLEGSHLVHAIFAMSRAGGLCVLQPPDRFNNVMKNYTDCLGMRYGFSVGRAGEGGFSMDHDDLMRALDRLHACLPHPTACEA